MSKVSKKSQISIQGILDITEDGKLVVEVEDISDPFPLDELFAEFKDRDVKIVIALSEDIE